MDQHDRSAETRQRQVTEIVDIARTVLSDLDLEAVLRHVLDAARDLTGALYAAVGVLDPTRSRLERFVTAGIDDATRRAIGPYPEGHGVLGELIRNPVPLRLSDVGAHPRSYGYPLAHPPMKTFLGVPVTVAGEPYGNLYLTEKAGGEDFTEEDEQSLVVLAELAGLAVDHARRFTASETRREELQRTVSALDATMQIAGALGGQTDLRSILDLIAKRARALVSARAVVIEYRRDGELVVAAGAGELPPGLVGQRVDFEQSVASAVLRTSRSQRIEDETNRVRFERHGLGRLGFKASGGLVVPLVFRGITYGVLVAVDRLERGPRFDDDDERLLAAFAASAATAVATAESVAAERRSQRLAATEQERSRWARELHDETLQGLAALRLGLSAILRVGKLEPTTSEALGSAVSQLDTEIAGLRALITELRPAALDQLGLGAAFEALADRTRGTGLAVELCIDLGEDPERLDSELETSVYRIAQEALTNARKNGAARRAVVTLEHVGTTLSVRVRDDGVGFDPSEPTAGFGLLGMHERAELLGGRLHVDSAPGRGTTITATFPAPERRPEPVARVRAAG